MNGQGMGMGQGMGTRGMQDLMRALQQSQFMQQMKGGQMQGGQMGNQLGEGIPGFERGIQTPGGQVIDIPGAGGGIKTLNKTDSVPAVPGGQPPGPQKILPGLGTIASAAGTIGKGALAGAKGVGKFLATPGGGQFGGSLLEAGGSALSAQEAGEESALTEEQARSERVKRGFAEKEAAPSGAIWNMLRTTALLSAVPGIGPLLAAANAAMWAYETGPTIIERFQKTTGQYQDLLGR